MCAWCSDNQRQHKWTLGIVISFGKEGKEKSNLSSSVYLNLPKYKWFIYLLVGDVLLYSLWPGFIL